MDFQYRDPERGFDRSSVKGVVAKLVRVKDPADTTALEVAAGGKLYQVVVDTEATAKALLSKGQLRNRVTIVPLNKVHASLNPKSCACDCGVRQIAGLDSCAAMPAPWQDRRHGAAQHRLAQKCVPCILKLTA